MWSLGYGSNTVCGSWGSERAFRQYLPSNHVQKSRREILMRKHDFVGAVFAVNLALAATLFPKVTLASGAASYCSVREDGSFMLATAAKGSENGRLGVNFTNGIVTWTKLNTGKGAWQLDDVSLRFSPDEKNTSSGTVFLAERSAPKRTLKVVTRLTRRCWDGFSNAVAQSGKQKLITLDQVERFKLNSFPVRAAFHMAKSFYSSSTQQTQKSTRK